MQITVLKQFESISPGRAGRRYPLLGFADNQVSVVVTECFDERWSFCTALHVLHNVWPVRRIGRAEEYRDVVQIRSNRYVSNTIASSATSKC